MFIIKKSFKWSPNGYDVETVEAGEHEELPEKVVEIAKELDVLEGSKKKKAQDK